tara:strand:- start:771 stop:881 length:111 start_codon:yes stop_codon:yes gene_type:complete
MFRVPNFEKKRKSNVCVNPEKTPSTYTTKTTAEREE